MQKQFNIHQRKDSKLESLATKIRSQCCHGAPSSLIASISALTQPHSCPWLMIAATMSRLRPKKLPPLMRSLSASASLDTFGATFKMSQAGTGIDTY